MDNYPVNPAFLFPPSLKEAAEIQRQLSHKVILNDEFSKIDSIAGMDVSNNRFDPDNRIHAAVVLLDKTLHVQQTAFASIQQNLPYRTGFLGFREAPALVEAFQKLPIRPDIILVDGHGISHPRRLGIASHIGVLLDCPTIGVAKSILVGKPAGIVPEEVGETVPLLWHNEIIGMMLRSKKRALPLIISSGHKVNLKSAVAIVKSCLTHYRLPEPTRHAHLAANACRREFDARR